MSGLGVGPYCNEDMDEWWVPVSAQPNRMKAAHEVRMCMDPDSRLRYLGREDARLTDHEPDCGCGCEQTVTAWHFEAVEA